MLHCSGLEVQFIETLCYIAVVLKTSLLRPCFVHCSGLEDQLLGTVVAEERPDLEEAKNQLIVSNAKMKQELKEIEDKILHRLSTSEGSPVDDIDLINTLEASQIKSQEIKVTPQPLYEPASQLHAINMRYPF